MNNFEDDGMWDAQVRCFDFLSSLSPSIPQGMTIRILRGTEGPKHDPYSWVEYQVYMPDGTRANYRDGALTGERLEVSYPNSDSIKLECPNHPNTNSLEEKFIGIVGYGLEQLEEWDEPSDDPDIVAAELAAGWDPNP